MNESPNTPYSQLRTAISRMLGMNAWGIVAGSGTGSAFTIKFGERILRLNPLRNPYIDEEARNFDSNFAMFLEDASWRLDDLNGPLCSSKSSNSEQGEMLFGLAKVRGKRLSSFELDPVGLNLVLLFEGGLRLSVFPDCMSEDDGDNYSVFDEHFAYTVTHGGTVSLQKREKHR